MAASCTRGRWRRRAPPGIRSYDSSSKDPAKGRSPHDDPCAPRPADDREEWVSRSTEIRVGATVLVALLTLIIGVTWLKQISLSRKTTLWHVSFTQAGGAGEGVIV